VTEPHYFGPFVGRFDEAVDRALDHLRGHPVPDRVFHVASALGDFSLGWHLVGVLDAIVDHRRVPDLLRLSGALGVESLVVNQGVKRLFLRKRPTFVVEGLRAQVRVPTTSSFPSGHASASFCAAVILTTGQPKLAPLWWSMALVVSLSRVYVRMHHASDVVVGAMIGAAVGRVAVVLVPLPKR
jgi:undecaprenyl-diphosphatase